jgi:hypothetical protein
VLVETGHGGDLLLGQPVQGVQQFGVLEIVSGQEEHLLSCERHVPQTTPR